MTSVVASAGRVRRGGITLRRALCCLFYAGLLLPLAAHAGPNQASHGETLTSHELVREVLQQNQSLAAMQAAVDAAQAQIDVAGALPDPMLSYQLAPATLGEQGMRTGQSVQFSQSFPWPGSLDLLTAAAQAEAKSTEQQLADLRLRLVSQARAAYAEWYYVDRALEINRESQASVRHLKRALASAYASGQASQQNVLTAKMELARLQNQELAFKHRRLGVQARINGLLNQPPRIPLAAASRLLLPDRLPSLASLRSAALDRYPALKALKAETAADNARMESAKKANYPSFTLMAGYNTMWGQSEMRPMVGVGINIPFGGNHKGNVHAAEARLRQSQARLANKRSQLLSKLAQTYAKASQTLDTLHLYSNRLLPLAKQKLSVAESNYRNSRGGFSDLVDAQRQLLKIRLEQAMAQAELYAQLAELNRLAGGALHPKPTAVLQPLPPTQHRSDQQTGAVGSSMRYDGRQP